MPQMMPMSWFMLFMFFTSVFMLFNMMNYYQFIPKKYMTITKLSNKLLNWKW